MVWMDRDPLTSVVEWSSTAGQSRGSRDEENVIDPQIATSDSGIAVL